ncbi:MAG: hypothetical protein GWN96_18400, partial [candidate division Zixibacteria bacterium]|nr:hypothetical protein [candidate division Zixibacteria bacterium]
IEVPVHITHSTGVPKRQPIGKEYELLSLYRFCLCYTNKVETDFQRLCLNVVSLAHNV